MRILNDLFVGRLFYCGLFLFAFSYYAPSFLQVIIGSSHEDIAVFRLYHGMPNWYKISAISFLCWVSFVIFLFRLRFFGGVGYNRGWVVYFFLCLVLYVFGCLVNGFGGSSLACFIFMVFVFFSPRIIIYEKDLWLYLRFFCLVLILIIFSAFFEFLSGAAWARFESSSGILVLRPSSFFYNPNLFGFWMALLGLLFSFGFVFWGEQRKLLLSCVVLASVGVFFSASRSFSYLMLLSMALLCGGGVFFRSASFVVPFFVSLGVLFGCSAFVVLIGFFFDTPLVSSFAMFGLRFLGAPLELFGYLFHVVAPSTEFLISFAGRFEGEASDSGLLSVFREAGWSGILALCLYMAAIAYGVYLRGVLFFYCFTIVLIFYIVAGFFISYSVMPVWMTAVIFLSFFKESSVVVSSWGKN